MSVSEESAHEGSSVQSRSSKRKRSIAWDHFSKYQGDGGALYASCHYCQKSLTAKTGNGTNHLIKHLSNSCPNFKLPVSDLRIGSPRVEFKFDQSISRRSLARMCIKHQYSFSIADHEEFEFYSKSLRPEFLVPCRNTLKADVMAIYEEEKVKVRKILDEIPGRVSFTTDMWTSDHAHTPFCCLTCHYIDDTWQLRKKILAFKKVPFPHDGEALYVVLRDLFVAWNLDRKIFSVVVDNASANNSMIDKLKVWLLSESLIALEGDLLHVRCSEHILNLIVQDGLAKIKKSIENLRDTVRYLNKSSFGRQTFEEIRTQYGLEKKRTVAMDVPNRWNSTCDMLETALPLKLAFSRLEIVDKNYCSNPSAEEWSVIEVVYDVLKVFHDATESFSGNKYPTTNLFFPEVVGINLKLIEWSKSKIPIIKAMAGPMKEKFDKYWDMCNLVLAVGVVFDPRFKMQYVQFAYETIYGLRDCMPYIKRVRDAVDELFLLYGGSISLSPNEVGASSSRIAGRSSLSRFEVWCSQSESVSPTIARKSELEIYLEEKRFPLDKSFDVLDWWKGNSARLPTMGRIARDVLAVPATTVASESAFSFGGRVLDESRSSLHPDVVEALVVTADWIRSIPDNEKTVATNEVHVILGEEASHI